MGRRWKGCGMARGAEIMGGRHFRAIASQDPQFKMR
jgi:hypothetical protein